MIEVRSSSTDRELGALLNAIVDIVHRTRVYECREHRWRRVATSDYQAISFRVVAGESVRRKVVASTLPRHWIRVGNPDDRVGIGRYELGRKAHHPRPVTERDGYAAARESFVFPQSSAHRWVHAAVAGRERPTRHKRNRGPGHDDDDDEARNEAFALGER